MRALITGGTGFVGRHLVAALLRQGEEVHLLVRAGSSRRHVSNLLGAPEWHEHDGTTENMLRIMERVMPDMVFHLASLVAAQHRSENVSPLIESNVLLGTQLLEAMNRVGVSCLVNTGTFWQHFESHEYNPVCLYAATKQAFEDILRFYTESSSLRALTLKLFDVYGPGDDRNKIFSFLGDAAKSGTVLSMTPGDQQMVLVYVDDVVRAFLHAADLLHGGEGEVSGRSYAVTSEQQLSLKEVVSIYERVTGRLLNIEWGGRPYRPREVMVPWRGEELPGWRAQVSLEEGIRRMISEDHEIRSAEGALNSSQKSRALETINSNKQNKKLLSIVVPVFNEEDNVEPLYNAIIPVMAALSDRYDYELIFTDNHSTDQTFQMLASLARRDERVRVVRFSRNFGYQRSIYTGYVHTKGDAVVQLDCDQQDPPELVLEFVRQWEAGYQVVYGVRRSRKEGWWINNVRKCFYRLIDLLSEVPLPRDAGDFRLIDRRVVDELKKINDYQPYLRGTIASLGFNQIGIPYDRAERVRGETKFSFHELITLALDGILNHSLLPLRMASYTGLAISALTFLGILIYAAGKLLFEKDWPAGFTTTAVLILSSISLNALFLGVIGEYLGRIFQQVKARPVTIIDRTINL